MSEPFSYAVNFQIRHPTAHADELASGMPWKASANWTAGDERRTPTGTRLDGARRESYCSFPVGKGDDGELSACLSQATDLLRKHQTHLAEVCRTGGSLNFYVFWYPNGDTGELFTPELLGKMATLNIALGLNVMR